MSKESVSIKHAENGQFDATTSEDTSFPTILQAIVAEATDYTKKSMETRLAFVEKLVGAKSFDAVVQIQSEYVKASYDDFVAQTTKIGELHSKLAKAAFKPVELAIPNWLGKK